MISFEVAALQAEADSAGWADHFIGDPAQAVAVDQAGLLLGNLHLGEEGSKALCKLLGVPPKYVLDVCPPPLSALNLNHWIGMKRPFGAHKARARGQVVYGFADVASQLIVDRDIFAAVGEAFSSNLGDILYDEERSWSSPDESAHCFSLTQHELFADGLADKLYPGFVIGNSPFPKPSLSFEFYIYREVCTNGMRVPVHRFQARRILEAQDPKVELREYLIEQLDQAQEEVRKFAALRNVPLDDPLSVVTSMADQVGFSTEAQLRLVELEGAHPVSNMYDLVNLLSASANGLEPRIAEVVQRRAGQAMHLAASGEVCGACRSVRPARSPV